MGVIRIDALCECEGCQKRFGVELKCGSELVNFLDFEEMVRDTLQGSNMKAYVWGVRGSKTVDRFDLDYWPSVQGGMMLCDECSRKCDSLPTDDDLSREQVLSALNLVES